ncbi:MAG: hypothetical protein M1825_005932 [Sarcosagium campestre]|nr:MAG: hypothetical protein M1825_005932 [Sarcosagium campestre]
MAGHDINYLAVSGVLSMLGRKDAPPYAPGNILGDFAGGGAMCFMGILMALYVRSITGKGQIVETNMVDGAAYLATMPRLATKTAMWSRPRGENLLDGGCPYYDVYETADLQHVAVGALEPQFFRSLLRGLEIPESALTGIRTDQSTWPELRSMFKIKFQKKTRREWEEIFDGTDACVTPVLSQSEIEAEESDEQVPFTLSGFFSRESSNKLDGQHRNQFDRQWMGSGLAPGEGGEVLLRNWRGWIPGRDFEVDNGGLVMLNAPKL